MTRWRPLLDRLAAGQGPSTAVGGASVAATQLGQAAAGWAEAFHQAGLVPGDRLLLSLPPSAPFVAVAVAALSFGLTTSLVDPGVDAVLAAAELDPRAAVVGPDGLGGRRVPWAWRVAPEGAEAPAELRPAGAPTPEARLLTRPGHGEGWVALSDLNLQVAVEGVLDNVQPVDARWLSALPWDQPVGLLLDLLPALHGAVGLVHVEGGPDRLRDVLERWQPTHAALPFDLVASAAYAWGGLAPLRNLVDGIVVGPGVDDDLARALRTTRLRTARGVPELSCLVTIGQPGRWRRGALGRPVHCELEAGEGRTFFVSGHGSAFAAWEDGQLRRLDPERQVAVIFE